MGLKECPFCGNKTIRILSDWEIEGLERLEKEIQEGQST